MTDLYLLLRSETNLEYFKRFRSALFFRFVSKSIVNSVKQLSLVFKNRSGRKALSVMVEGEGKPGISAYSEDP